MASKLDGLKPIILIFLVAIIGVTFIVANDNSLSPSINSQPIYNESVNFASARIASNFSVNESKVFTVTYSPVTTSNLSLVSLTMTNQSGTAAVLNTDYKVNLTNGQITFLNSSLWQVPESTNTSLINYNYYSGSYVKDTASRSIFSLIDFMSAIGVLLVVVGYLYRNKIWEYLTR